MSDILSQAEIDALLNALTTGTDEEAPPEEVSEESRAKLYDFRTANRFPKEQIRTLNIVFQTYAQLFSNRLTNTLRTSCECELLSVEELTFNEFNNSLPSPVILAVFNAPPMEGSMLFEISPEVAYLIIDRLLGGASSGSESSKQFTEIELALVERILRQFMGIFEEAWAKVLAVSGQLERIETSSQFTQIIGLNDPIAVVTLNLKVGEDEGLITVCLPHETLEPVARQLNTRLWYSTNASHQERVRDPQVAERMSNRLIHTPVSLIAHFENTPATVVDIVNLQVGDVIRLNHKTEDPIRVKVEHIPKFKASIGTSGSHYAVQITDIIKEENEDESFAG